jgi:hypothetical protein
MDRRRFVTISGFAGASAVHNGLWEVLGQNRSADATPRCPLGHKQIPYCVEGSEITVPGGRTGRMMICSACSAAYIDWVKVEEPTPAPTKFKGSRA